MSNKLKNDLISLKPKIINIIGLANANKRYDSNGPTTFSLSDDSLEKHLNRIKNSEPRKKLDHAFENLTDDEIMLTQIVMYIGRDERTKIKNSKFEETMEYYFETLRFELGKPIDRRVEIAQMTGKGPLDTYLRQGIELLNL